MTKGKEVTHPGLARQVTNQRWVQRNSNSSAVETKGLGARRTEATVMGNPGKRCWAGGRCWLSLLSLSQAF